ncbi:hypothetical protein N2152v2_001814 [Parachlorella kessleri]
MVAVEDYRKAALVAAAALANPTSEPEWDINYSGASKDWQRSDLHVVLVHPQIPQNAGNVSRTCAATSVALHLVGPLGFNIDSKKMVAGPKQLIAFSKFARQHYAADGVYRPGMANFLMFGAETSGLPKEATEAADIVVKIPMVERHVRSLNLATSVGVGVYEALRQLDGAVLPEEQQLDPTVPWSDYNAVQL